MAIARALDGRLAISYLTAMAARLLLTLLALLAGFAAPFAPAQARGRAGVDTEIGAIATEGVDQRRAVSALPSRNRTHYRDWRADERPSPRIAQPAALVPTVLPGIDRARE